MSKVRAYIVGGVLATPLIGLLAVLLTGGGHSYASFIIFFPWTVLLGFTLGWLPFWAVGLPALAIQFPLYGLTLGYGHEKGKLGSAAVTLLVVHFFAALFCLGFDSG